MVQAVYGHFTQILVLASPYDARWLVIQRFVIHGLFIHRLYLCLIYPVSLGSVDSTEHWNDWRFRIVKKFIYYITHKTMVCMYLGKRQFIRAIRTLQKKYPQKSGLGTTTYVIDSKRLRPIMFFEGINFCFDRGIARAWRCTTDTKQIVPMNY